MGTFVLATRNSHKAGEIGALLGPQHTCRALAEFPGAPSVIEDAATFAGNARKKAVELAAWLRATRSADDLSGAWVLADDSGLEVDALGGAPGVYSARFAACEAGHIGNSTDADNNARLLRLLAGIAPERRTARFRCVIALAPVIADGAGGDDVLVFDGLCEGRVLAAARGVQGFGYDPLFQPVGFDQTFAELGDAFKNQISHRARALAQVTTWIEETGVRVGARTPE